MNLIKNKYNLNSYYCTWTSQSDLRRICSENEIEFSSSTRDFLNDKYVFGDKGLVHQFPELRDKLFFLFDDGWDVPYGLINNKNGDFGSLIVNEERFPFCTGEPKDKLKKLADRVKNFGWKGVGIWVCASAKGEVWENMLTFEERKQYWCERFEWSKYAGISYWKVDWGSLCNDIEFRKHLNEWRDEIYPELIIEHAPIIGPFSGLDNNNTIGRFKDWDDVPKRITELSKFSDVIRTYDVSPELSVPTTIDRVQYLLRAGNEFNSKSHVNAEDQAYVCAALSVQIGIMSNQLRDNNGNPVRKKSTESIRAVNWLSCFAPPLPICEGNVNVGNEVLSDECNFVNFKSWLSKFGDRVISQAAPDLVSRNDTLPNVKYLENEKPYILSNRHKNGAYEIAVLPRFKQDEGFYTPAVQLNITQKIDLPIGVFGEVNELNIEFDGCVEDKRIFAQDLASDEAVDITDECFLNESTVKLSGELINKIGKSQNAIDDESKPGLVIKLI